MPSNQKINVCVVCGDSVGGLRKHVHDILLSNLNKQFNFLYVHSLKNDQKAKQDFIAIHSLKIKQLTLSIQKQPHWTDVFNIIKIASACKHAQIDVLHGHGAKGGLYSRLAGLILRIPVIYTPHGGSVHGRFGRIQGILYHTIERLLVPLTDLFIFESYYTWQAFTKNIAMLPQRAFMINHNGASPDDYHPTQEWNHHLPSTIRLIVIGSLQTIKGQHVAIQAVAELRQKHFPVTLEICGDGEEKPNLQRLAQELGVTEFVLFQGDTLDVSAHIEQSNIVLIPSLFESFGYVAIEAALMKRPVVASATGGLPEIIIHNETGLLFKTGDASALTQCVMDILADTTKTSNMVAAATQRVLQQFSMDQMLGNLNDAYQRMNKKTILRASQDASP